MKAVLQPLMRIVFAIIAIKYSGRNLLLSLDPFANCRNGILFVVNFYIEFKKLLLQISQALEDTSYCKIACPGNCIDGAIVKTSSKLAEIMVLVFVNMCIVQGLSRDDVIK